MLFLSFVATCRAADICQRANAVSCVTLANLDYSRNNVAYFGGKWEEKSTEFAWWVWQWLKKKKKKEAIIDLRSVTNRLLEVLFHCENRSRLTAAIWNIYVLISGPFHWYHTGTPVDQLGGGGETLSFDHFLPPFSLNASWCRYVLSGSLPGSHINVWNPFLRYELKIYAVSLPWSPTVACRSSPQRPHAKRLWKIKHSGVGMGLLLLVCSHL